MRKTFSDIFEEYLNYHLTDFAGKSLNGSTMNEISSFIFNKTQEIFHKCEFSFSENACRFIANVYSNDLEINGEKINGRELETTRLDSGELDMLEGMFFDREDILEEIKKVRR